jgi:hypothetical protein
MTIPAPYNTAYSTYKSATKTVLYWLKNALDKDGFILYRSPSSFRNRTVSLARELVSRKVQPPQYIREAFESALTNRLKVSEHYIDQKIAKYGNISAKPGGTSTPSVV